MKLEEQIIEIIKEQIEDIDEITETSHLEHDLGIDSFGVLMIIDGIEDAYKITIEEDSLKGIETVLNIVEVLQQKYGIQE